nr:GTP-binding protein [Bacilli bacterium]
MKVENIRNVVILGHQGSGKTTLAEALAFTAGAIPEKGEIEKKTTISDYTPEEQKRGSSIQTAVVPFKYGDYKINLLDIPGNDDFVSEAIGVTGVVKGAVLVIDASIGVQVGTVKHYKMLRKKGVPTFIFVNKMDKEDVDFEEVLEEIRQKLGNEVISFCYPLGHEKSFDGFANVIDLKAHIFNGKECEEAEIYPDKRNHVLELYNTIVEEVAKTNDELLEKFFGGEQFTPKEIHDSLRIGVLNGTLTPLIVGSATKNIGIHTLLRMFVDYYPAPNDLKPLAAHDEAGNDKVIPTSVDEPFSAYVFKTVCDPYTGITNIIKVCSGVLHPGDEVLVNGEVQKISALYEMCGKKLEPVQELIAGDIGAVNRMDKLRSGDTLSSPKNPVI